MRVSMEYIDRFDNRFSECVGVRWGWKRERGERVSGGRRKTPDKGLFTSLYNHRKMSQGPYRHAYSRLICHAISPITNTAKKVHDNLYEIAQFVESNLLRFIALPSYRYTYNIHIARARSWLSLCAYLNICGWGEKKEVFRIWCRKQVKYFLFRWPLWNGIQLLVRDQVLLIDLWFRWNVVYIICMSISRFTSLSGNLCYQNLCETATRLFMCLGT